MRCWAVISNTQEAAVIKRFRTYWDALQYAAILQQNSQSVTVRFVK